MHTDEKSTGRQFEKDCFAAHGCHVYSRKARRSDDKTVCFGALVVVTSNLGNQHSTTSTKVGLCHFQCWSGPLIDSFGDRCGYDKTNVRSQHHSSHYHDADPHKTRLYCTSRVSILLQAANRHYIVRGRSHGCTSFCFVCCQ